MRSTRAAVLLAICIASSAMAAQEPSLTYPYPANIPLTLSSGTVVRQRNVVVFRGHHINTLTITIESPTPAADADRVIAWRDV